LIASMKNDKHWKCVRKSRIANIKNSLTLQRGNILIKPIQNRYIYDIIYILL